LRFEVLLSSKSLSDILSERKGVFVLKLKSYGTVVKKFSQIQIVPFISTVDVGNPGLVARIFISEQPSPN
jgi:hypothetical protein